MTKSIYENIENFKLASDQLIGLQANLHSYQSHLSKLSIGFQKKQKRIILGFVNVDSVIIHTEWEFRGMDIVILPNNKFKFYDNEKFEVVCSYFGVFEEVVNHKSI